MGGGTPVLRDSAKIGALEHIGFIWVEVVLNLPVLWPVWQIIP